MRGRNRKRQPPASRKGPFDSHAAGFAHGDQVVEDAIHDLFIERGRVAKRGEVIFQGFRLHAFDGRRSRVCRRGSRIRGWDACSERSPKYRARESVGARKKFREVEVIF